MNADEGKSLSCTDAEVEIQPISAEARRQVLEGIPRLRALREQILADRGGEPVPESVLNAALHEARAAHERGG